MIHGFNRVLSISLARKLFILYWVNRDRVNAKIVQSASQKMYFRPCDANVESCSHQIQFYGTPSKVLVTPNEQDHGVPGLKAKIRCAIPG